MSTFHQVCRALGVGLALSAVFALANGCSSADPASESTESPGEDREALARGIYRCASQSPSASLVVSANKTCTRFNAPFPGASEVYCRGGVCSSCQSISQQLGCFMISPEGTPLDLAPGSRLYHCTMAAGTVEGSLLTRPDASCSRYPASLSGASREHCQDGVCPSCWRLGRDLGCAEIE